MQLFALGIQYFLSDLLLKSILETSPQSRRQQGMNTGMPPNDKAMNFDPEPDAGANPRLSDAAPYTKSPNPFTNYSSSYGELSPNGTHIIHTEDLRPQAQCQSGFHGMDQMNDDIQRCGVTDMRPYPDHPANSFMFGYSGHGSIMHGPAASFVAAQQRLKMRECLLANMGFGDRMPVRTPPMVSGRPNMPVLGAGARMRGPLDAGPPRGWAGPQPSKVNGQPGATVGAFKQVGKPPSPVRQPSPQPPPRPSYAQTSQSSPPGGSGLGNQFSQASHGPIPVRYMSTKMAQCVGLSPPIPAVGVVGGQLTPGYFLPVLPTPSHMMPGPPAPQTEYANWVAAQYAAGRPIPAEHFLNTFPQQ